MTYVSFPAISEKILEISPVAFTVFGRGIRWYGLIICTGIILAILNTMRNAKKEGISSDDVLDYAIFAVPLAIIGARLYYVLTSDSTYKSLLDVLAIWRGGLAIYGAIIAGAVTVFVVSKVKKISFLKIADAIAPSVLIGQFIGRWGNFCNGEAFGHLDRIEFLGKVIPTPNFENNYFLRMTVASEATDGRYLTVHPTFLYESVWNLAGFILLTLIYRKKKFDGQMVLCYLAWYGLGRFFIEGLRADSLLLGATNIRVSQLLALLTFIFSVLAFILIYFGRKKKQKEESVYTPVFSKDTEENVVTSQDCKSEVQVNEISNNNNKEN